MTDHTPEPWVVGRHLVDKVEITSQPNAAGACTLIADVHDVPTRLGGQGDRDANARRIAACVNALAGIPTSDLEACVARFPNDRRALLAYVVSYAATKVTS